MDVSGDKEHMRGDRGSRHASTHGMEVVAVIIILGALATDLVIGR